MAALTDRRVMNAAARFRLAFFWVLALGLGSPASRAQNAVQPIPPSDPATNRAPFSVVDYIDRQHKSLSDYIVNSSQSMDNWLSGSVRQPVPQPEDGKEDRLLSSRQIEEGDGSRIKVTPILKLRDGEGVEASFKIRARLNLPRFEKRLALVFSNLDEDGALFAEDPRTPSFTSGERQSTAALRYFIKETLNFKASADAGLRFRPEPDPKLRLRLRLRSPRPS